MNSSVAEKIEIEMKKIWSQPFVNRFPSYSRLIDIDIDIKNRNAALKQRQIDMRQGLMWQAILGCQDKFTNLEKGDPTGLDIRSDYYKLFMEIKNCYNTDNSSSREKKFDKLCATKLLHSNYRVIYGVINDKTDTHKIIRYKNVEIEYMSGKYLFQLVFGNNYDHVLSYVCDLYKHYRSEYA